MLVMDYLNLDFEEFLTNLKFVFEDRAADRFRRDVADAMNILRHEKVERWKSKNWFWAEEPTYHATAKSVADGSFDREKQDALYIRVGGDGSVACTPASVAPEVARAAFERAGRLGQLVDQVLKGDVGGLIDYDRVKGAIGRCSQVSLLPLTGQVPEQSKEDIPLTSSYPQLQLTHNR